MSKKKICVLVCMSVGWKTYYKHMTSVAKLRTDIDVVVVPIVPDLASRLLTHTLIKKYDFRLMDPIYALKRQVKKWWDTEGKVQNFDHIHFASHILSGYFCEKNILPYSVTIDITRKNNRIDLGEKEKKRESFSQRSLAFEERIINNAAFIHSLNTFAHESLLSDYGVADEKITMSYPSLPMNQFTVPKKVNTEKKNILFVGNDIYKKGGDRLVKWHQEHFSDIADLHMVSFEINKLGKPSKSQYFYPDITYDGIMNDLMPIADVFVLPARFDLCPYAAVEAMAHALPLVTSSTAGMQFMCRDQENGFCIKNSSDERFIKAIRVLLTDTELARKMGQESRNLAEQFFDSNVTYNALLDRMKANIQ